jgi:hypothetical protein
MKHTDFDHWSVLLPTGSATSTPADYINILSMILNNGRFNGKQDLSKESVYAMEINKLGLDVTIAYSPELPGKLSYGCGEWVPKNSAPGVPSKCATSPCLFGSFP